MSNELVVRDSYGFIDMSESMKRVREFGDKIRKALEKPAPLESQDIMRYSVRLYQGGKNFYYLIYSCNGTRLETIDYDNESEARSDFHLLVRVIKTILHCEGMKQC